MKKIALVVPVHNHLEHTSKCIGNLDKLILKGSFKHSEFSIIVVDDGSTDGTYEWLVENYPSVDVVKGDGTLWWSGGVNAGARYAIQDLKSDYILLWNNDIVPAGDYFVQMDKLIYKLESDTLLGSKIFYMGGEQRIWSCGGMFDPKSGKKYMVGMDKPDSDLYNSVLSVDWLPGMGTLVPVEAIHRIGYWDEKEFPQYHGDSDFTYRAKQSGFNIIVHPGLRIWNDKSSSGLTHGDSIKGLIQFFTSIRSNLNIHKNVQFYRRHAVSWRAYGYLIGYYMKIIGGFMKWKIYALFGKYRD